MILNRFTAPGLSLLFLAGTASQAGAATAAIGMASAQSGVVLDNASVSGNATVFEGSNVQSSGYSRIHLNNGSRLDLAAGAKAQLFANRVSLEQGMTELQSSTGFEINARTLRIQPSNGDAIARVKIGSGKQVLVTALNSPVKVMNKDGQLVARVTPGSPMSFVPQTGATTSFDNTGCIVNKGGAAVLVDSTGNQSFEIRGLDLRQTIGSVARVTGTVESGVPAQGGASAVVKAMNATTTKKGACSAEAARLGASVTATGLLPAATSGAASSSIPSAGVAPASTGVAEAVFIVVGVAAATGAAIGGAAAAGAFSTTSP